MLVSVIQDIVKCIRSNIFVKSFTKPLENGNVNSYEFLAHPIKALNKALRILTHPFKALSKPFEWSQKAFAIRSLAINFWAFNG